MLHSPIRLSVRPSARLSALRFRTLTSSFTRPIFFKLCLDIHIRELWFGIANWLNLFINNIFRTNGWILKKFCIYTDIYKNHVVSNARSFWSIFNRVMALDRRQNFVYAQCLVN